MILKNKMEEFEIAVCVMSRPKKVTERKIRTAKIVGVATICEKSEVCSSLENGIRLVSNCLESIEPER
jgi:hypothetical protein